MSDYKNGNQDGLISSGNRGLVIKSSSLVRRGLDLISARQPRIIQFSNYKSCGSLGKLYIRDINSHDDFAWKQFSHARGSVTVPPMKALMLELWYETEADLSALENLKPDDLYELAIEWHFNDKVYLKYIQGFTKLKSLSLSNQPIIDEDIILLQELKDLENLNLLRTNISDKGLESLSGFIKLRSLTLSYTRITDSGIMYLKELKNLKSLSLDWTEISDEGLIELQNALPYCNISRNHRFRWNRKKKERRSTPSPELARYYDVENRRVLEVPVTELEGLMQACVEGIDGLVWIDPEKLPLALGELKHPPFDEDIREYIRHIHTTFIEHRDLSFDDWEEGFRCDKNPAQEIALWSHAADVYSMFAKSEESLEHRKDIYRCIVVCLNTEFDDVWNVLRLSCLSHEEAAQVVSAFYGKHTEQSDEPAPR